MYVIIKNKSSKKYNAAIPVKKGVSLAKLKNSLSKRIKGNLSYKIVTETQLKNLILAQRPRMKIKNKTVKRKK